MKYAPEYRCGLSNHLPMAMVALRRLGATRERMDAFEAAYAKRLVPAASAQASTDPARSEAWPPAARGIESHATVAAQIHAEIARLGAAAVLRALLPSLMAGAGAAAFHGLIRTAYAVESGDDAELAEGLAYWTVRHLPLGPLATTEGTLTVDAWAGALARKLSPSQAGDRLIFEDMHAVSMQPRFATVASGLAVDVGTLRALSRWAAVHYVRSADFTVLHLVTSAHAMRLVLPFAGDATRALRWYAQAWAAALASVPATASQPLASLPPLWPVTVDRALASDNDHVVKLVHTCREEAAHYGDADGLYRAVAARATRPACA